MLVAGIIIFCFIIVGVYIAVCEVRSAITVDPNAPFLYGDYDKNNDPILKFQKVFCENCQFFDGTDICLKEPMSDINDARVSHCKATSMFVAE